jgi:DNA-nicking Smr family endonuclease
VLVITGKGESQFARHTLHGATHFNTPERRGKLRRMVPDWLHEPEFRALVSGFQPAHPKHGGGGAFYVKLRRARNHP